MTTATPDRSSLRGILLMLGALAAFAAMDALIKGLRDLGFGTMQLVFFRSAFGLLPLSVLIVRAGGLAALRTRHPFGHVVRALIGVAAMSGFFYAFGHMPLADAYAIYFAAPLFLTALSVPFMGEQVGLRRWAAVAVGFVGVLIILRPTGDVWSVAALVCLMATVLYAVALILIRHLSRTETNAAIVFYFSLTSALVGAIFMLPEWRTPTAPEFLLLVTIGLLGGVAQILLTQSLRLAPVSVLAPFEYTSMLWAILLGYLFWGDVPVWSVWVGGAIVVASGLYIVHRESRLAKTKPISGETPQDARDAAAKSRTA